MLFLEAQFPQVFTDRPQGTVHFIDPAIFAKVAKGIAEYCEKHGEGDVKELRGGLVV